MNINNFEEKRSDIAFYSLKDRLKEPLIWFPFPALIAFGLTIILGGHLLSDLNPRKGSKADVIQLNTKPFPDGGIWIGLYLENEFMIATTSDKTRFSWHTLNTKMEELEPLIQYLKKIKLNEAYKATQQMENNVVRSKVIIAVDQKTKYLHLRPLIYALAEAKISKYGFETRIIQHK